MRSNHLSEPRGAETCKPFCIVTMTSSLRPNAAGNGPVHGEQFGLVDLAGARCLVLYRDMIVRMYV
jgi:hypothetical protein